MEELEQTLKTLLIGQQFVIKEEQEVLLEKAKSHAHAYAQATNGIAALSDLQADMCYIYSGKFGQSLGLKEYTKDISSAFELSIFNNIPKEEVVERHILELRFFHYLKTIPFIEKINYQAVCLVHFRRLDKSPLPVLHTTRYLECHSNGSIWLGLCTYVPISLQATVENCIINTCTGETVQQEQYAKYDKKILSKRQIEILSLLSKGISSKQIADMLNISINTVNRHRQDIILRLHVTNTAAAVEIGLRMHLI